MKVSVLITTFNHEGFISQAIDSVLMQEVKFDYEIVIGEDASTDRTQEIVLAHEKKYPGKIRVLLHDPIGAARDRALGIGGKSNFMESLRACQGQYLALLDGDDYWTDPHKLQKQTDFLDNHPDFAICFHDVELFYEDKTRKPRNYCPPNQKEISTIADLLGGNFMQTCSVMLRNHLFGELPEWFYSAIIGDWVFHILNAEYGKIGYLNEVMAAYRVHQGGFWTSFDQLDQYKEQLKIFDHLDEYLGAGYKKQIEAGRAKSYQSMSEVHYRRGDIAGAWSALVKSLRIFLSINSIPNRQLLGRLIKLQTYKIYEWLGLRFRPT